jgi:glycosyltransferase involved in cell wall biosynthesis
MRILVLAHSFPRFPGDTHGPFVERLAEEVAARGHQVHVLVPYDRELRTERDGPLKIHAFRYVWPERWHALGYSRTLKGDVGLKAVALVQAPLYFHFGARALSRWVRREAIDLVHAHWILPNGYLAARVAAATGVPYTVTLHGSDVFMAERNALFRRFARRALAGAARVTSCSAELQERLLQVGGEEYRGKVLLVPNGTDLVPRLAEGGGAPLRDRLGVPRSAPLLVAVGRLVAKKGFSVLLQALPRILAGCPGAWLVLGGGGALEEDLKRRARELGVGGRVVFTGALAHPQVLELVAAADVFVMPSVRDPKGNVDGLPVVVLEAMAAGRPVVATAVSGMPLAVTPGETGLLVPERDPEALAAAVGALLADPERARRLGRVGRERIERELHWGAIAAIHEGLYREALEGR